MKLSQEFCGGREPHFGRPVQARRISSAPTSSGSLWTRFEEIPEFKGKEPETNEERSQNDLYLERGVSVRYSVQKISPDETSYSDAIEKLIFSIDFFNELY